MKRIRYGRILIVLLVLLLLFLLLFKLCPNKKEKLLMIDLKGLSVAEIKEEALKLKVNLVLKEESDSVLKGELISQSIEPGSEIEEELIVIISSGSINYKDYEVDESGNIPIMMYHGIWDTESKYIGGNVDVDGYQRTVEAFKKDLEFYYNSDYRMIKLKDYIEGIIDVPLGKSPLVLTFDDGLENNIKVIGLDDKGEIIIDPNSAVGILESFKNKYPDFNVTATFFINGGLFHQPKYNELILKWLVNNGYDIGNHTYNHLNLRDSSSEKVQKEVVSMLKIFDNIIPNKYIDVISLPFGEPKDKDYKNFKYMLKGEYENYKYENSSALRVGWQAELSPFHKNFDKTFLMRIRAYDNKGTNFDIEHNFNLLNKTKYISDGNKERIVVPKEKLDKINSNLEVITY